MRRNALTSVLLMAVAVFAFCAYREYLNARRLAGRLDAQAEQLARLAKLELRQGRGSAAESPEAPAAPHRANRVVSDVAAVVPPIAPRDFASKDDVQDLQDIQRLFVPTLLELGLSGEQVAKVRSLMLEARRSARDARDIARERGWRSGGMAIQAANEAVSQYDPQIRAAVGDENFTRVRTILVDESYFRRVQFAIAPDAELFGAPLSADQKLALARAMAGVLSQAGQPQAVDSETGLTPSDQQILDRAKGALSDAQVAVLRRYFARQHLSAAGFTTVAPKTKN